MRYLSLLSLLACAALLACGQEPAPTASGPAGKASASADCTLAEIFSGKEGCQADPSLDVVPDGYVPPVDTTATAPADTLATAPAPSDSTGTGTGTETPSDTSEPESETPSGGTGAESETPSGTAPAPEPEPVVPEPVVVHVPGEDEPETARSTALTPEQARARLESNGIAYTTQAFVEAAAEGNASAVSLFVQAGMDKEGQALVTIAHPFSQGGTGRERTALHAACVGGHLAVVTYLVNAARASVSSTDGSGGTALHAAVGAGNLAIVQLLVNNGAAVNAKDSYSETPLYHAASYGYLAIVEYLVGKNADITIASHDALTPYGVARLLGHTAVVNYLRPKTEEAFIDAAMNGNLAVVKSLVTSGISVDTKSSGFTALHRAASGGQLEVVKYLVGQGASLTATNSDGRTARDLAARGNLSSVVTYLEGAARAELTRQGYAYTADAFVSAASGISTLGVVKLFVQAGIDLDKATRSASNGWAAPALSNAAYFGRLAVVEYLVGQGANIEATARDLSKPLHWAALGGYLSVVKYLVGQDASLTATDRTGSTPRDSAVARGHTAVVEYFDSL